MATYRTIAPHPDTKLTPLSKEDFFAGKVWCYRSTSQPAHRYEKIDGKNFIKPLTGYSIEPIIITSIEATGFRIWVHDNFKFIAFKELLPKEL